MASSATVSVVVPARNEERTLAACLESLRGQQLRPLEILVIDDGSTDGTAAIARAQGIEPLSTGGVGPSRGRNLAAARARGELLAFTDADCVAHPGWLRALCQALPDDSGVAGVGGPQQSPTDELPFARQVQRFLAALGFVSDYLRADAAITETSHNPSCNSLYRRQVFVELGGFREDLWPCEDLDLDRRAIRAGYRLLFAPAALVYHHRPTTMAGLLRMMRSYGRGHGCLVRIHGPYRLLHLMPLAVLPSLALAGAGLGGLFVLSPCLGMASLAGGGFAAATLAAAAATILFAARGCGRDSPRFAGWLLRSLWQWHAGFLAGLLTRRGAAGLTPRRDARRRCAG
jgi:GT2 family glycosyltransferase